MAALMPAFGVAAMHAHIGGFLRGGDRHDRDRADSSLGFIDDGMNPAFFFHKFNRAIAVLRTVPGGIAEFERAGNILHAFFRFAERSHILLRTIEPRRVLKKGHDQLSGINSRLNRGMKRLEHVPGSVEIVCFAPQMPGHALVSLDDESEVLGRLADPFHEVLDRLNGIEGAVDLHD
ncbi:hypothetical protein D3C71_1567150 [compost metagenome]